MITLLCAVFVFLIAGEEGIPVTDSLVKTKCAGCHPVDDRGNMKRISWERASPEGWEQALKRMTLLNDVDLTPAETRRVLQYLSTNHGLAPEEARGVMYDVERRIHEETGVPDAVTRTCVRCHSLARLLSWRRSADDWSELSRTHALRYNFVPNEDAVAWLAKTAPLHTPEWDKWRDRPSSQSLAGRWLVTASVLGRPVYQGEMQIESTGEEGEFNSSATLHAMRDGSTILRTGQGVAYAGYAWRGSSKGTVTGPSSPDDLATASIDVMTFSADLSRAEGRWFWGQYQELGVDVKLQRASPGATLLAIDRPLLKTGSTSNRIRLAGDHFPTRVAPSDFDFGTGVSVRRIVSNKSSEVIVEVDVASNATRGKRDIAFRRSTLPRALALYDRIDYLKVHPDSALAAFGNPTRSRGYQQFAAVGYQNGPDRRRYTADDVELGPVDVTWSLKLFYENDSGRTDPVGVVSPTGLFVPATDSPNNNFDVWVIAEARTERDAEAKPLTGKSYLVVTVPVYTFNGRRYVRDLDRWVDDGPAQSVQERR